MASPHNHGRDKFKELLRSTLVSSVEKPKELVIIPSTLSVYEGFTVSQDGNMKYFAMYLN